MRDEGFAEHTRYVVEVRPSRLGYVDMAELGGLAAAAAKAAPGAAGPVRFVRVVSLPDDGSCLLVFEAGSEADVEAVARDAFVDFERLGPVLLLGDDMKAAAVLQRGPAVAALPEGSGSETIGDSGVEGLS